MPASRRDGPWLNLANRLTWVILLAFPRGARVRDGEALVDSVGDTLVDVARSGGPVAAILAAFGEWWTILRTGIALRARAVVEVRKLLAGGFTGITSDFRYAVRVVLRRPGFALGVSSVLALGVGASTAMYSVTNAVLLRPLGYPAPERLALVWQHVDALGGTRVPVPAPDVAVMRERGTVFESIAFTSRVTDAALTGTGYPRHVRVGLVTPNFFELLGVPAARGRVFSAAETPAASAGQDSVATPVVITDGLWRRVFGSDPGVVGRSAQIDGRPVTVTGIMPSGFVVELPPEAGIGVDVDIWTPLTVPLSAFQRSDGRLIDRDSDNSGAVIARLREGVSLDRAQAELDALSVHLRSEVPAYAAAGVRFEVRSMAGDVVAHARPTLVALSVGVGLLLLIACLNASTLLVARGEDRIGEIALRGALGASVWRIARQLMTESALLAAFGCIAGIALSYAVIPMITSLAPPSLPGAGRIAANPIIMAVALGISLAVAAGFGVLPALRLARSRGRLQLGDRTGRVGRRAIFREGLVVAEVGLSVALLIGAALLVRTVGELNRVRPGFDPEEAVSFKLSLRTPGKYDGPAARARFISTLEGAVKLLPGVEAVGLVGRLPLGGRSWTQPYGLPGQSEDQWSENRGDFRTITSGYFAAMGTTLFRSKRPRQINLCLSAPSRMPPQGVRSTLVATSTKKKSS